MEVLLRPELGLDAADVLIFGLFLTRHSTFVRVTGRPQGCRDPKDDMFLETARVGEAQMLVTFDNDLLAFDLVERLLAEGVRVLSIGDFVRELREARIVVDDAVVCKADAAE